MRIGVVGINHKLAELKLRELLAKACQRRFGAGNSTHGEHHFVLLSTCNRTEVYFSSEDLAETHTYLLRILRNEVLEDFDQKLYSYFGHDCFLHLSRVTAGLDSAIVAETEIQGQVKKAYESATEYLRLPYELHYLFQKALKIGKKVRSELPLQRGLPELEHAILNVGINTFSSLTQINILFVGASEINQKILNYMHGKNIQNVTLCNRSVESAEAIAQTYNLKVLNWACISEWHSYDWIIFGTKSPEFIINKEGLPKNNHSHKLIIDLSVPRNVDPKIGKDSRITLLNIDEINRTLSTRKKKMNNILNDAEEIVTFSAKQHLDLFQNKEKSRQPLFAIGA
jgi:glutamyl-tRNA reductase